MSVAYYYDRRARPSTARARAVRACSGDARRAEGRCPPSTPCRRSTRAPRGGCASRRGAPDRPRRMRPCLSSPARSSATPVVAPAKCMRRSCATPNASTATPSTTIANSSPPIRNARPSGDTSASAWASRSSSSWPAWCPQVSFVRLRPSRSTIASENRLSVSTRRSRQAGRPGVCEAGQAVPRRRVAEPLDLGPAGVVQTPLEAPDRRRHRSGEAPARTSRRSPRAPRPASAGHSQDPLRARRGARRRPC